MRWLAPFWIPLVLPALLGGCNRSTTPGSVQIRLDKPQIVSIGLYDESGKLVAQPLTCADLATGKHEIPCGTDLPPGKYRWKAVTLPPLRVVPLASVGAGVADAAAGLSTSLAGGDTGPPCAVATEGNRIFLGWRSALRGHEVVCMDSAGKPAWGHHHGPDGSGVRSLAADGKTVFVLGGSAGDAQEGGVLYKLDAETGSPVPWADSGLTDLPILDLWAKDDKTKLRQASHVAADNGRIYLTFPEQFIAVLDGATGKYLSTLTGPHPGQMALSMTPFTDYRKGREEKFIDFGVAAIGGNGLAYFLMEHDPIWVMMSTTHWLAPDEKIAALTLHGNTMAAGDLTIYTGLAAPHHQVQLRPAESVENFKSFVGRIGGRPTDGPWVAEAFRDIRSIAVDSAKRLWVAEGDETFGRFSVWDLSAPEPRLVREIFGPLDPTTLRVDPADPLRISLGGLIWKVDAVTGKVACVEHGTISEPSRAAPSDFRMEDGLILFGGEALKFPEFRTSVSHLSVHSTPGGSRIVWLDECGAQVFRVEGLDAARTIATGKVTIKPTKK